MIATLIAVLLLADPAAPAAPKQIAEWTGAEDSDTWGATFVPNGTRALIGGSDRTVVVRDVATGKRITKWNEDAAAKVFAFSRDGSIVAIGDDHQGLTIRDVATGKEITWWSGNECQVVALAFSSDASRLHIGCRDGGLYSGDLAARKKIRSTPEAADIQAVLGTLTTVRPQPNDTGVAIAFSPDRSRAALGLRDGSLIAWNMPARKKSHGSEGFPTASEEAFTAIRYFPHGQKVVGGGDKGTIAVWETLAFTLETSWVNGDGEDKEVVGLAVSPDGKFILSGDRQGSVRLWDASGKLLVSWTAHGDWVNVVAFSPDGTKALTGGDESPARLWDLTPWTTKAP